MADLLVQNAEVLTADAASPHLHGVSLRIRGNRIQAIGDLAPDGSETVIDAAGCLVLPGLVNTHAHLFQNLIRDVWSDLPLPAYLRRVYLLGANLTGRHAEAGASLGALDAVMGGVTTIVDHHFLNPHPEVAEGTIAGMRQVGVRSVVARTVMDLGDGMPTAIIDEPAKALIEVEDLLRLHADEIADGSLHIWTGPNTPGVNAGPSAIAATTEFAQTAGIRRSAHVAEYSAALTAARRLSGTYGVVRWLDTLNALGPDLLAVHAVHLDDAEIALLGEHGCSVSHNPFSNLFCGERIAPVGKYVATRGISVGLGTDGAANNDGNSILDVARTTRSLSRLEAGGIPVTLERAFYMATIEGARAAGLEHEIGSIQVGKRADIALWKLAPWKVSPPHDRLSQLLHAARPSDVSDVIIDGRVVVRHGRLAVASETDIVSAGAKAGLQLQKIAEASA